MTTTHSPTSSRGRLPIALLERMAMMLRVLAHPHRLKIIEMLESDAEATVSRIHAGLGLPQAATSQHLNHMKKVGLLASERRGKEVWYRIADARALTILGCIRKKHGVGS
ncbi:MAG TPA: metalloregulator ArsR/SmtB family transcription factor [Kiritimatiellia bacterium]|nr:metalloregulator ArsR/SmtB family transcription factor [Kiritimatiellia bacterium]HMO98014.1 metalloregulator ArsR/SmtB family transcription factor [Kiritimatiellia bacterium]HMP97465.1 metalloregulator ArsR/SmtB family transcription factor [Kiritimatiellia bacterium]